MKIFESKMNRLFGTAYVKPNEISGLILKPGDNVVSDEDAAALLKLEDTKERIELGMIVVRDLPTEKKTDSKPVKGSK